MAEGMFPMKGHRRASADSPFTALGAGIACGY